VSAGVSGILSYNYKPLRGPDWTGAMRYIGKTQSSQKKGFQRTLDPRTSRNLSGLKNKSRRVLISHSNHAKSSHKEKCSVYSNKEALVPFTESLASFMRYISAE
jgi:hypothetical protein